MFHSPSKLAANPIVNAIAIVGYGIGRNHEQMSVRVQEAPEEQPNTTI